MSLHTTLLILLALSTLSLTAAQAPTLNTSPPSIPPPCAEQIKLARIDIESQCFPHAAKFAEADKYVTTVH